MKNSSENKQIVFSDEHTLLLETAASFCRDKSPIATVRELLNTDQGYAEALWQEMVQLGWTGIAIPESHGGSELGLGAVATILEPMGRHLMATPLLATTLAAQLLIRAGSQEQCGHYLPKICEGSAATLALTEPEGDWNVLNLQARAEGNAELVLSGQKTYVLDGKSADFLMVSLMVDDRPGVVLLNQTDLPTGALSREIIQDETRRSYTLNLNGIRVSRDALLDPDKTVPGLQHVKRVAELMYAADMAGGIAGVLDVLVEYLTTRKQFDRLIGSYQALKHPTVDILMGLEASRSHVYHAATVLDDVASSEARQTLATGMAKAVASDAYAFAGDRAIQFHGGFGFTYECDAQLFLRRALFGQYQFGDSAYHRGQLEAMLL